MALLRKWNRRNEEGLATLGANIRKYRKLKNLTIEELANLVEVDYSQISRMERALVNSQVSLIFDIAKILDIQATQLFEKN